MSKSLGFFGRSLVAVTALSFTAIAAAEKASSKAGGHFNYNYVEVDYVDIDAPGNVDWDGARIFGSMDIQSNLSLIGSAGWYSTEGAHSQQYTGGVGYHMPLMKEVKFDLYINAEIEYADLSYDDDTGVRASGGVRWQALPNLELHGGAVHATTFKSDSGIEGGIRFNVSQEWQLTAHIQRMDEDRVYLGARFNF